MDQSGNTDGCFDLVVVQGPHAGAQQALVADTIFTVGNELSNDIVLFAHHTTPQQLECSLSATGVVLSLMHGEAYCDGEMMELSRKYKLPFDAEVRLGETVFCIRENTPHHTSVRDAAPGFVNSLAKSSRALLAATVVGVGFILVVFGLTAMSGNNVIAKTPTPERYDLLIKEKFPDLNVDATEPGRIRMHGEVPSREDLYRLRTVVAPMPVAIDMNVKVRRDIAGAVSEIYRLSNVNARVDDLGNNSVRVTTSVADESRLDSIEKTITADVAGINRLLRNNTPPKAVVTKKKSVSKLPAGKRITLVVAGDPSYLLTEDESRYFVGSQLPSGHRISTIEPNRVLLDRDGAETVLEF